MAAPSTVQPGETILTATMVAKADGTAITSGTVNVYVKALTGANAGKWYKNSDSTWQASETANAMTYLSGGAEWSVTFTNSPFADGVWYSVYAKESGGLHVPYGQSLRCQYVPSADSSNRVDVGKVLGTASQGAAGYVGIDWGHVNAPTTSLNLSGTTIATATTLTNDPAGVTTLLARLGAFAGSGVNTVLGFFKALLKSDASAPSDVGGTYDPARHSAQALKEKGVGDPGDQTLAKDINNIVR